MGPLSEPAAVRLRAELAETTQSMARYLRETADYERTDRLWPAHFLVFATNPLSVAYGACGPALFLGASGLPDEVAEWMLRRPLSVETYPPGLYLGLAGIAHTFHELGFTDEADSAMAMLYRSPLLYEEPGVLLGAAGWGLTSLRFHTLTGRRVHLDQAVRAGEHLLRTARRQDGTCHWQCGDGRVQHGFGHGASGIALFLLNLHLLTGRPDFRACAIGGLDFDLAHGVDNELGRQWGRFQGDTTLYPYWIHGSAGVGGTVIRFARALGSARYEESARRIAEGVMIKYAYLPSLFEGLAGIGEFMLDMFRFTGDETYRSHALDMAESILWFKLDRPQGTAFPGRRLTRISNDYATGAAGIGLFFERLLRPGPRLFVDLPS